MKAVGVVVEYNPFHNGHKFHLDQAKEKTGADIVIAVMSGNFLQRGEPALVSKWSRTEMALHGGADLVFELPYIFATQNADIFADGAISILAAAGCENVCFGSESGEIDHFTHTLDFLAKHQTQFQEKVKEHNALGYSYPKSLSLSFQALEPASALVDLAKPNNILGLQYIAAINRQGSGMQPITIQRKNADYHDEHFSSESIASATSIRKSLFSNESNMDSIQSYLPRSSFELLLRYKNHYGQFHSWGDYWPLLKYKLLQSSPKELADAHEVEEGLENRLLEHVLHAHSFQDFMRRIKTKRYTWTRLQRVCLHILMNVKRSEMQAGRTAKYLRLLGMSAQGRAYLQKKKKTFELPLVSKPSASKELIEIDIKASRIYSLGLKGNLQGRLLQEEFSQPPIQKKD
jgi:predicted nucleotidyltransferase